MRIEDVKPQMNVVWQYVPRGGWGFVSHVSAVVVEASKKRVKIRVRKERTGEYVVRTVRPENLRPATER